ncbi:dTDP-4-dehydrorhamnose 3,5-epimerase [Porphyromonas pogonae]|uniref:dTDP-4-dehydrorhamnose 3,5-epimerase n=1 Tax=Porphyromonas pogonae TaxID=867595 RepID=UPI002E7601A6|nr:dTDP-4-dehydrorhamnose 3,5-epimerase [Porphyromonas pogonae]
MEFRTTSLSGVYLIIPKVMGDHRGYFMEFFLKEQFEQNIGTINFVQENESFSTRGVLRGLHLQRGTHSQAKLIRCVSGSFVDVVVDLRAGSPTYGQTFVTVLSAENKHQLFVPRGFAHGFLVTSDTAIAQYKVDNAYSPQSECSVRYDDEDLAIDWEGYGVSKPEFKLSDKDLKGIPFREFCPEPVL